MFKTSQQAKVILKLLNKVNMNSQKTGTANNFVQG